MTISAEEARHVAAQLSKPQRDLLVEHVDGRMPVRQPVIAGDKYRVRVTAVLARRRLLAYEGKTRARPTHTRITDDGRAVLAWVLADYAQALLRSQYGIDVEAERAVSVASRFLASKGDPKDRPGRSILTRQHDGDDRRRVVAGAADGLERDEPMRLPG